MSLMQILLISVFYGAFTASWLGAFTSIVFTQAFAFGWLIGLLMGDVATGALIGAQINAMYLGMTYYGGTLPADTAIACAICIPLAISSGLDIGSCLIIAVPCAALGSIIAPIVQTINTSVWTPYVDKACEESNTMKIKLGAGLFPFLTNLIIKGGVCFICLYLGDQFVAGLIANMPAWLQTSFTVMGNLLPALGFATYIRVIGTTKTLPFFIFGFFLMKILDLPIIGLAVIAFTFAYMILYSDKQLMGGEQ